MSYNRKFKRKILKFCGAVDSFSNWLFDNPPPHISEDFLKSYSAAIDAVGLYTMELAALVALNGGKE